MSPFKKTLLLVLLSLPLTACGTPHQEKLNLAAAHDNAVTDPDDTVMRTAVEQYLVKHHQPASSQYEYVRQDLDGDGRREAIVMFESPFYSWCSSDGCKMVVFKASDDQFAAMPEIAPVRGPLLVSNTRTRGWRDLIVRISGRTDIDTKDVALKFDGSAYPGQPEGQPGLPAVLAMADINGTQIFP